MAQRIINIGSSANKGDGDPIRTAFGKVNDNFTELYGKVTVLEQGQVVVNQDVQGDLFGDDSSKAYDSATGTFYGKFVGDLKGTIAADDSTVLIDGPAGTINASALTGALPAIDGSALTGVASAFSDLTGTPTTIAGYGITDAYTKTEVDNAITSSVLPAGSTQSIDIVAGDSTLLVDSVNGTLNATALTGALPAIDGSALTGITATETDTLATVTARGATATANISITGTIDATDLITSDTGLRTTGADGVYSTNDIETGGSYKFEGTSFATTLSKTEPTAARTITFPDATGTVALTSDIPTAINDLTDVDTTTIAPSRSMQPLIWDDIDNNWYPGNGISLTTNLTMEDNSFIMLRENAYINFEGSSTDGFDTKLDVVNPTANRTVRLPDADGTLALTSDIPSGPALEGSSLQPADETSLSTQGTTLELSGGDSTGLNSDGGDLTLVGGNGSSGTHGDISIGATQTGSITIGSGSNNVDFPSGTTVDFTGATVTGLSVSGLQSRSTATGTTSSLADAAEANLDITGFKSYMLLTVTTDRAARVRLYTTGAARTADASRAEGVDPTSDAGVIAEVITTGAQTVTISPGALGFNLEGTPTTNIPTRVTNKSGSTSTVQVDLNILQLEA